MPYAALIALGLAPEVPHDTTGDVLVTPPAGGERLTTKVRELEHQLELERVINRERERTIEAQHV